MEKIKVKICMGSSCFARGNKHTLGAIQDYLREHAIEERVELVGSLCDGNCNSGPHITINGDTFECVDKKFALDLIKKYLSQ